MSFREWAMACSIKARDGAALRFFLAAILLLHRYSGSRRSLAVIPGPQHLILADTDPGIVVNFPARYHGPGSDALRRVGRSVHAREIYFLRPGGPASPAAVGGCRSWTGQSGVRGYTGMDMVMREPSPRCVSTDRDPPRARTASFAMDMPRPLPERVSGMAVALSPGWKSRFSFSLLPRPEKDARGRMPFFTAFSAKASVSTPCPSSRTMKIWVPEARS